MARERIIETRRNISCDLEGRTLEEASDYLLSLVDKSYISTKLIDDGEWDVAYLSLQIERYETEPERKQRIAKTDKEIQKKLKQKRTKIVKLQAEIDKLEG